MDANGDDNSVTGQALAEKPEQAPDRSYRILVAEDDFTTQNLLKTLLSHAKYDVTVTENGQKAWDMLETSISPENTENHAHRPFDVVVCDWNMPGLNGLELVKRVRENRELCLTYVILITASSTTERLVLGFDQGADDYVSKPFKTAELLARVKAGCRIRGLQYENSALQHQLAALHLAATASHEINNPLMILMGNWELLKSKLAALQDATIDKRMQRIRGAAERIQGVADSLKDLRKVELTTYLRSTKMINLGPQKNAHVADQTPSPNVAG